VVNVAKAALVVWRGSERRLAVLLPAWPPPPPMLLRHSLMDKEENMATVVDVAAALKRARSYSSWLVAVGGERHLMALLVIRVDFLAGSISAWCAEVCWLVELCCA
jgi:hypothetical protein